MSDHDSAGREAVTADEQIVAYDYLINRLSIHGAKVEISVVNEQEDTLLVSASHVGPMIELATALDFVGIELQRMAKLVRES